MLTLKKNILKIFFFFPHLFLQGGVFGGGEGGI